LCGYFFEAPQALPQAAGFFSGSAGFAAPQALPQAAGFFSGSAGFAAPQALPQEEPAAERVLVDHSAMLESMLTPWFWACARFSWS
jgi:hypothetical protein